LAENVNYAITLASRFNHFISINKNPRRNAIKSNNKAEKSSLPESICKHLYSHSHPVAYLQQENQDKVMGRNQLIVLHTQLLSSFIAVFIAS